MLLAKALWSDLDTASDSRAFRAEYPLVLGLDHTAYSLVLCEDQQILAHANLWPRLVVDGQGQQSMAIGLVGNVVTQEEYRGRGLMRSLFQDLTKRAHASNLKALLLWSDLTGFYQKLGFSSCALEKRYYLRGNTQRAAPRWGEAKTKACTLQRLDPTTATDQDLYNMLMLRPKVPRTLARAPGEMRMLLQIPHTHCFTLMQEQTHMAFAIVGRGHDLRGVVHEWGAADLEYLRQLLSEVFRAFTIDELLLLAPPSLSSQLDRLLKPLCLASELHPMALCLPLASSSTEKDSIKAELQQLFVWGLDSI